MTRVKEIKRLLSMKQQKRDFHFLVHMDYIYHVTDHCGSLGKS